MEDTWEYETEINGAVIRVNKIGGGTPGKAYTGYWEYSYQADPGASLVIGQDATSGMPKKHGEMAEMIWEYMTSED